jgi:hypothetical protein
MHEDLVLPPEVQKVFDRARNLTTSVPRKHHNVPESYLRRWEENGQIRVTEVDVGRDYVTSPGRAARVAAAEKQRSTLSAQVKAGGMAAWAGRV